MHLARRLEAKAMERFNNDKRLAIKYLQQQCTNYAWMSERRRGTPRHAEWRAIYKAYVSAEFSLQYSLDMETSGLYDDFEPLQFCQRTFHAETNG